jgi:hypothetical protein
MARHKDAARVGIAMGGNLQAFISICAIFDYRIASVPHLGSITQSSNWSRRRHRAAFWSGSGRWGGLAK